VSHWAISAHPAFVANKAIFCTLHKLLFQQSGFTNWATFRAISGSVLRMCRNGHISTSGIKFKPGFNFPGLISYST